PQGGNGRRLIVDVDAIALVGRDLAPDDDLILFRIQSKTIQLAPHICFEDRLDHGAAFAATNHFSGSLGSRKQSERIDDDGFSGSGFTGQKIETFFEVKLELVDQSEISNAKKPQHTRAF